ncbi:MAG: hypothetical protein LBV49_07980 [Azonexus sp.]|jgi:hypothetical protein|nr:hypothetical protein [Azonexus sp.]
MDVDFIAKIGVLAFGSISTLKLAYDWLYGYQGCLRDEYKFAKEFMRDIAENKQMHPFVKQKLPSLFHHSNLYRQAKLLFCFFFTASLFVPAGFLALRAGVRIIRADNLVANQNKHLGTINQTRLPG